MGCSCTIDTYYESNTFYDESTIRARKPHACCECGDIIKAGDKYKKARGMTDGRFWEYKTCLTCVEIRSCFFCTWIFSEMFERLNIEQDYLKLAGLEDLFLVAKNKFFDMVNI